jgi:hypothetical protein
LHHVIMDTGMAWHASMKHASSFIVVDVCGFEFVCCLLIGVFRLRAFVFANKPRVQLPTSCRLRARHTCMSDATFLVLAAVKSRREPENRTLKINTSTLGLRYR